MRSTWLSGARDLHDRIELLDDLSVDLLGAGQQAGEKIIVALQQEVGQPQLGKVRPKQRVEKVVGGLDVRLRGPLAAERLEGCGNFLDRFADCRFPAIGLGGAEQVVGELLRRA